MAVYFFELNFALDENADTLLDDKWIRKFLCGGGWYEQGWVRWCFSCVWWCYECVSSTDERIFRWDDCEPQETEIPFDGGDGEKIFVKFTLEKINGVVCWFCLIVADFGHVFNGSDEVASDLFGGECSGHGGDNC